MKGNAELRMSTYKKESAMTNAEKQKRYRERQKDRGNKEMRGYLSPEAKNVTN